MKWTGKFCSSSRKSSQLGIDMMYKGGSFYVTARSFSHPSFVWKNNSYSHPMVVAFVHNSLSYPNLNSISLSINDLRSSHLISLLLFLLFFTNLLFLLLCNHGRKISKLVSISYYTDHLKSNSVLFTDAIALK